MKERTVLNNVEDALAIALQEFLELSLAVDLPDGKSFFHSGQTMRAMMALRLQHVCYGVRGIGRHEQSRCAGMLCRQVQRQRTGNSRLSYSALSHHKSQLGHNGIVCVRQKFYRKVRRGRKVNRSSPSPGKNLLRGLSLIFLMT